MSGAGFQDVLRAAGPEVLVALAGLLTLTLDLTLWRRSPAPPRFRRGIVISLIGCAAALAHLWAVAPRLDSPMLTANPLTQLVQTALLILAIAILLLCGSARFTNHVGEYLSLILFATAGMMILAATRNLLVVFLTIEFLSLCLYILTGFDKRSRRPAEAALKYFLFGGMSAAFFLFGISLLYGFSGSIEFDAIAAAVRAGGLDPMIAAAIVMVVIGLGFKVAAAPFHFWAPDAYQGAPPQSAAFIASSSKVVSFFVLFEIMTVALAAVAGSAAFHAYSPGWAPVLAVVAVLSMLWGNLAALAQNSLRRLLAYSATAHAGYMLIALAANSRESLAALLYYIFTYALAAAGVFGVLSLVGENGADAMDDLAGLSRRAPGLSFCLLIFLLSLAGVPPLAGFFGKFYVFVAALRPSPHSGLLWLVLLAIAMSVVSLYYYLKALKKVYVSEPTEGVGPIAASWTARAAVWLLAGLIVLLGCAPDLALSRISLALMAVSH